ncbi:MAG: dockerin type I domain-containing protein, partial [Chloroflexi bacterium]|nr:dockerin type I domain-containing protein [Chloroflexota bacterium]
TDDGTQTMTPTPATGTPTDDGTQTMTPTPTATSTPFPITPTDIAPTFTPTATPVTPTEVTPTFTPTATPVTPTEVTPTFTPTNLPSPTPTVPTEPYVSTVLDRINVAVNESAVVTVSLHNVPAEGYASAEFTCEYNPALVEVSNISVLSLFGEDPVTAMNGPQNGSFIFAIAGSNGRRAVTSGPVFSFQAKGLQPGSSYIECNAQVSKGDGLIAGILSLGPAYLTVHDGAITPTSVSAPVLNGQALASKPVVIRLYNAEGLVVLSTTAAADGTFTLTAPAGVYGITASADGFLGAQGFVTLTDGAVTTMPVVRLAAGDVDNNGVIDQFDAMTIGMSYNTSTPTAADLNNDGVINVLDLEALAGNYRRSGMIAWQ